MLWNFVSIPVFILLAPTLPSTDSRSLTSILIYCSRVQNLFHSVQLNVNNPHFLIMQGRITKVLNMKPPEILGLLEEAAGTKMYETKKQAAMRTLEKKQVKVDEINKVSY